MTVPRQIQITQIAKKLHQSSAGFPTKAPIAEQAARLANATARQRTRPDLATLLYGKFEVRVKHNSDYRQKTRDRLAYVYVTGQFPSHLRPQFNALIRTVTSYFKKPVALDGRSGNLKLKDEVVQDLDLEAHPMVLEVRARIASGFLIQPSIGRNTRRTFWKIFLFKTTSEGIRYSKITVQGDGAVKQGWR